MKMLTRRSFLTAAAVSAAGIVGARLLRSGKSTEESVDLASSVDCRLATEQILGPYYLEKNLIRKNMTEGQPGLPLLLGIQVIDAETCQPVKNAAVDVWHCNASGLYSGFTKVEPMLPPSGADGEHDFPPMPPPDDHHAPPPSRVTDDLTFLRGIQLTNNRGLAEFETIYPGWYAGRSIHIHFRVRVDDGSGSFLKGHCCHTGQVFIDEKWTAQVSRLEPYKSNGAAYVPNAKDMVYRDEHGSDFILDMVSKSGAISHGLHGTTRIAVNPSSKTKMG